MNRTIRLSVLLALVVAWFSPAQLAWSTTLSSLRSSAASECQKEDDPQKCLAELAKESSSVKTESEDESEDSSDNESEGESEDSGDDQSDSGSEDEGDDSGSNGGSGTIGGGKAVKDKDKDRPIPARIIKSSGSTGNSKPSQTKPGKRPDPGSKPDSQPLIISTDITSARAALLRTATTSTTTNPDGNDDYIPRLGGIMNHTARIPGAGTKIAADLAVQAAQVKVLRDAISPVPLAENQRNEESLSQALLDADFSDPAEEFMAKAAFGATVLGAGAVALAASAIRNRRKLKLEQDTDYDYDSAK